MYLQFHVAVHSDNNALSSPVMDRFAERAEIADAAVDDLRAHQRQRHTPS
jgi:hypothetical protein